jgi:uncharacterized protein (DUF427 family)
MAAVKGPGVVSLPGAVAVEPARRRVRVKVDDVWVADSDRALTLFENGFTPRWYLPLADVRSDLLVSNGRITETLGRGPAHWFDLRLPSRTIADAAWCHPSTPSECPSLDGYVSFEWNLMTAWYEEDDEIIVHPRDPYTRVDVLRSSRRVSVALEGTVLAEADSPLILLETGAPTRYYLPAADVDARLLLPSDSFTWCPYKGRATYRHVRLGNTVYRDLFWTYEEPLREVERIAGHLCPFNEFLDITVDGVLQERPVSKWAFGGPNAYTFRPGDEAWDPTVATEWNGDDPGVHR